MIFYTYDLYVWQSGKCVFKQYMDQRLDMAGSLITVASSSNNRNDEMCAMNIYLQANDCGRRCSDEELTFYLLVGDRETPDASLFDGPMGLMLVTAADYLGAYDSPETYWFIIIGLIHYGLEIITDFTNVRLFRFISDTASACAFAWAFPFWASIVYELYNHYMEVGQFKMEDPLQFVEFFHKADSSYYQTLWAKFILFSAPVMEQNMEAKRYDGFNTLLVTLGIGYWLFDQYYKRIIKDKTQLMMMSFAAFLYVYVLERIW